MEIVGELAKTTLGELEKVLTTRTVVGEPMTIEGVTLIPLISIGFGFGAGGGSGKGEAKQKGEGAGGGTGGGAWIRPVAIVVIDILEKNWRFIVHLPFSPSPPAWTTSGWKPF